MNIDGMTDGQKRKRIAEACGWNRAPEFDYVLATPIYRAGERMEMMCKDGDIRAIEELPDYLNDLNAMHEGEQILDYDMRLDYMSNLIDVVGRNQPNETFSCITATARQRADAFLLTLPEPEQEPK